MNQINKALVGIFLVLFFLGAIDVLRPPSKQMTAKAAIVFIGQYKSHLSPRLDGLVRCRFHPSCSAYAVMAIEKYGTLSGGWLTLKRLAKCSPLSDEHGDDYP